MSRHGPARASIPLLLTPRSCSRTVTHRRPRIFRRNLSSPTSPTKPSLPRASSSGGPQAPEAYCADLVRRLDPEAWLCSYFWPRREKAWWLAWRAFNLELHLISTTVTQPALAAIRFQFWRDALQSIFASRSSSPSSSSRPPTVPQHPVAVALSQMRQARPIQRYYLSSLIETRAKTLALPPSSTTLQTHLDTYTPLSTALLLGPLPLVLPPADPATSGVSHTLSHLATLLACVSLLRNLPGLVRNKKQINVPHDICAKHGIVEEEVLRQGAEAKGLRDGLHEVGTRGMDELITARRDLKDSGGKVKPGSVVPLFLAAIPAEAYLKRLEDFDFDVFHPGLQKHDWKLAPQIWWRAQTGRI